MQDPLVKFDVPIRATGHELIGAKARVPPYTLIESCKPFVIRISPAQRYLHHLHFVDISLLSASLEPRLISIVRAMTSISYLDG